VESVAESIREVQDRPVGFPAPPDPRLVRALRALDERRIKDAQNLVKSVQDEPDAARLAWTTLLSGLIALERPDLASAGTSFALAAFRAIQEPVSSPEEKRDRYRLAAWAFEKLGLIYRRQDHLEHAYELHLEAYHLRGVHGSFDELWETAVSLGLDAHLAAWGHHDDAVDAARRAVDLWRVHDPAATTVAKAEMNLGYALLKQGESLHDIDAEHAAVVLRRAIEGLDAALEALRAFGAETAADAQWCNEQLDFARRLRAAL